MRLNPYLNFNGQCEAAFRFYEKALGGKILMMLRCAETPVAEKMPPGWGEKIMHTTLAVGDFILQGSDVPPEHYRKPQGISVSLNIPAVAEAERVFKDLSEKATVTMPLQETFWARRFGMLTDQFGIPWMINCGKTE